MEKIFLGIGAGPIQTGIYVAGASRSGYDRIVLADVDAELVTAVRASGSITVNTARKDGVHSDTYPKVEIYNPNVDADRTQLIEIAARACAVNTALPSVSFYKFCVPWLKEAFDAAPDALRFVYTSENSTTAAAELHAAFGKSWNRTHVLDTVIGKMSKVFSSEESELPPLAPGYGKGHLVEEFNTIYTTSAPGIDSVGILGLYPKQDIYPFEEAKLYGHNASHLLLGILASVRGCRYMSEAVHYPEIVALTRQALFEECGPALCKKFRGVDEYFELDHFLGWANELVDRMTSRQLSDSVDRVIRDLDRKLAWRDRIIGAMRLCVEQGVEPAILAQGASLALRIAAFDAVCRDWPEGRENDEIRTLILKH